AEDLEKATSEKGATSVETVVNSAALDYSARVYPNPASSYINVAVNASRGAVVKANIYAIDGRLVMSNVINQTMDANRIEKTIPLKLQAGVYSVKLNVNGVESDHRFICVE
ncbi:MAG: T9SS type A sorting domain-containing protein, partial [Saprospiraceae bacterium]|nr:T9SS type A sorting domain-containing protein [Saprospiraceae bacterium]